MTDRSKLLALAEAVEKLTGPDREVDAEIYEITSEAIDYQRISLKLADASRLERWHDGWVTVRGDKGQNDPYPEDLKPYTASLDAAMTLVPEGWCKTVADWWAADDGKPPFFADCGDLKALKAGVDGVIVQAWAATPALALCAAALRAQAEALA